MKVLWFSLSPCSALEYLGKTNLAQGWMISLEKALKAHDDIQLEIAYISEKTEAPFEYDGVKYYPVAFTHWDLKSRIKMRLGYPHRNDNKLISDLLNIVQESKPDLIHIHGTESAFGLVADYVKDIPVVYSIQGMVTAYYTQLYSGLPYDFQNKSQSLTSFIHGTLVQQRDKAYRISVAHETHFLQNAKYVFGRTFWDKNICRLFNRDVNYQVVNEILRNDFYHAEWEGIKKNKFNDTLTIISTISPGAYKGFETLLQAARLLKENKRSFRWQVIGLSKEANYVTLCEKYTGIDASDVNVELCGRKTSTEMVELLTNADIYCQVSHIENSPNSACEAMLLGMPVVATFAGGTASILENRKEGLLFQDGEPYVMAGTILEMASDFNQACTYAKAAKEKAADRHKPENVVKELINGYKNILTYER